VAKRVPAHVTLFFPFAAADLVDEPLRTLVQAHFAGLVPFDAELDAVRCFDEPVWLAPASRARFVGLIAATWSRFPDRPPYGGAFDEPTPDLTAGQTSCGVSVEAIAKAADVELAPRSPLRFHVGAATLLIEQEDGTWVPDECFPLGR
jgi:hypothetical protein